MIDISFKQSKGNVEEKKASGQGMSGNFKKSQGKKLKSQGRNPKITTKVRETFFIKLCNNPITDD